MSRDTQGEFLKLAATMLRTAGREFGNHGCNDFSLAGLLDGEDQLALAELAARYNGEGDYAGDLPYMPDFVVMLVLAHYLENL